MPPSRIAFALGDLIGELVALLNSEERPRVSLGLDAGSFDVLRSELVQRGTIRAALGATARMPYKFNGVTIHCLPDEATDDKF